MMNRRTFVVIAGGALFPQSFAVRAQGQRTARQIGFLSAFPRADVEVIVNQLRPELDKLGWTDGRNIVLLEARTAEGRNERLPKMAAELVALMVGIGCFLMVTFVKGLFGYDDALDAFGVHGAGGTMGALLTGVFATRAINPIFHDAQGKALPVGWLDGHPSQIGYQLVGIAMAWVFALVGTIVLLKVTDLVVGD